MADVLCTLHQEPDEGCSQKTLEAHRRSTQCTGQTGGCEVDRELFEQKGLSKTVDMFDRHRDSLHSFAAFPEEHWRRLRTTNMMERVNLELKRRTKKIGAFPDDASLLRLTVSLLMDIDEECITGRRYLNMEAMEEEQEGYTV